MTMQGAQNLAKILLLP